MHVVTIIGLVLGAGIIFTDHQIHKIPSKLAIPLYSIAIALLVAGFILAKQQS